MIDFDAAIKFPTKDPNWIKKIGMYALFQVIVSILVNILNFSANFTTPIAESLGINMNNDNIIVAQLMPSVLSLGIQLIVIPITFYFVGYTIETVKNVMQGIEPSLPEHTNISYKIKLAFGILVSELSIWLTTLIALAIASAPIIIGILIAVKDADSFEAPSIILIIIGIVLAVAVLILSAFLNIFVKPAMKMNYLKTEEFSSIFDFSMITQIIKTGWVKLLTLLGARILIGIAAGVLSLLTFCLSMITQPIINTYARFVLASIEGNLYKDIYRDLNIDPRGSTGVIA